jgi:hypothetical protein
MFEDYGKLTRVLQKFRSLYAPLCEVEPSHGSSDFLIGTEDGRSIAACVKCFDDEAQGVIMAQTWKERWEVKGTSGKIYTVALKNDDSWGCNCPAWIFQKAANGPRKDCQHILHKKMELMQEGRQFAQTNQFANAKNFSGQPAVPKPFGGLPGAPVNVNVNKDGQKVTGAEFFSPITGKSEPERKFRLKPEPKEEKSEEPVRRFRLKPGGC